MITKLCNAKQDPATCTGRDGEEAKAGGDRGIPPVTGGAVVAVVPKGAAVMSRLSGAELRADSRLLLADDAADDWACL